MISVFRILLPLTLLARTCLTAVDICFWEASVNCDTGDTHLCCNNLDSDRCCDTGNNGFCIDTGVFGLTEESEEDDTPLVYEYFTNGACTQPDTGICAEDCCEFLGEGGDDNSCSGLWEVDEEAKKNKKRDANECAEPNFAYYKNENGTGRGIHIPQGSYSSAVQMIKRKDYNGLSSFEDWADQE